jgi:hypothetical protein
MMSVKKLWARKLKDGAEVRAALFHDHRLGEATAEISVKAAHAEDDLAIKLAGAVRDALDARGAEAIEQESA